MPTRKTKVVQAGYTKSLDYLGAALAEFRKGNTRNASRLFAAAAKDESVSYAMNAIHATNRLGLERLKASVGAGSSRPSAKRRRQHANVEEYDVIEPTDDDTMTILESLVDEGIDEEEILDEEILESELDEGFDDELDAEEDDIDDILEARARGRSFASALRRSRARR